MSKRKSLVLSSITLVAGFGLGIMFVASQMPRKMTLNKLDGGSMIAMYIQDGEGNYNLSDAHEFPKDGYVLNTEKSSCKNGGVISQNSSTKALSLKVKTSDECTVYFDVVTSANPSADMLIAKANGAGVTDYATGNKKEMFVFDHPEATQTTGWTEEERRDYRYIGNEPNNYITFNDETWRIIGVFTVETESGNKEQLTKIIRDQSIGDLAWDSNNNKEWSTASLQKLLNGDYYNQTGDYSGSSTSIKGLNVASQNRIVKVKWYLGNSGRNNPGMSGSAEGSYYYSFERTKNIVQHIGLMYPSDYSYTYAYGVDDICYTNGYNCDSGTPSAGWLFSSFDTQWTQSSPDSYSFTFVVSSSGPLFNFGYGSVNRTFGVRPTLYLSSSIKIVDGDGSQGNPYILGD